MFNEVTNILGIDIFFILCDVAKTNTEEAIYYIDDLLASIYVGLIAVNVCVHLTIMARVSYRDIKIAKTKKKWDLWLADQPENIQA